jgi:hypothetical protein
MSKTRIRKMEDAIRRSRLIRAESQKLKEKTRDTIARTEQLLCEQNRAAGKLDQERSGFADTAKPERSKQPPIEPRRQDKS